MRRDRAAPDQTGRHGLACSRHAVASHARITTRQTRSEKLTSAVAPPGRSISFRFDCVFYYVSDLDRAVRFYSEVLGLRLVSRDVVARFRVDGVLFELVPTQDEALLSGSGNARLTLAVDDIEKATSHLAARAVPVSAVRQVSNGLLASCRDPDGNELVLWQAVE